jgi:hypothetical protein
MIRKEEGGFGLLFFFLGSGRVELDISVKKSLSDKFSVVYLPPD